MNSASTMANLQPKGTQEQAPLSDPEQPIFPAQERALLHQVFYQQIANILRPQYFITLQFPEHMTFRTIHKRLDTNFRELQSARAIQQAILIAGILVQGQTHIHLHALVRLLNQDSIFLTAKRYQEIYRPILRTFEHHWTDTNIQLIEDHDRTAAYIGSPRNAKLFEVNGISQSEPYFFNRKRLNRLEKRLMEGGWR